MIEDLFQLHEWAVPVRTMRKKNSLGGIRWRQSWMHSEEDEDEGEDEEDDDEEEEDDDDDDDDDADDNAIVAFFCINERL